MDNLSLKFCETYPDEFPLFDPFQICYRLVDEKIITKYNLRLLFNDISKNNKNNQFNTITKDQVNDIFISLKLNKLLNLQEILTLLRRIKNDTIINNSNNNIHSSQVIVTDESDNVDIYYYNELCDIVSHAYSVRNFKNHFDNNINIRTIDDLQTLLRLARQRHTQWRR